MTVSSNEDLATRHGFTTAGVIETSSALFFVLLLAHIQLKNQFQGAGIVYMESFYFLMYAVLIFTSVNTYFFNISTHPKTEGPLAKGNLLFKVSYWPVVLGSMAAITAGFNMARH